MHGALDRVGTQMLNSLKVFCTLRAEGNALCLEIHTEVVSGKR